MNTVKQIQYKQVRNKISDGYFPTKKQNKLEKPKTVTYGTLTRPGLAIKSAKLCIQK